MNLGLSECSNVSNVSNVVNAMPCTSCILKFQVKKSKNLGPQNVVMLVMLVMFDFSW